MIIAKHETIFITNLVFLEDPEYNKLNLTWSFSLTKNAQQKKTIQTQRILQSSKVHPKGELSTYLEKI